MKKAQKIKASTSTDCPLLEAKSVFRHAQHLGQARATHIASTHMEHEH